MRIEFLPRARREMHREAEWYERRRVGFGDRFYVEMEKALAQIKQFPGAQPHVARGCRKVLLGRFPFSLIYAQPVPDLILIVAVAHMKRRPDYWKGRM